MFPKSHFPEHNRKNVTGGKFELGTSFLFRKMKAKPKQRIHLLSREDLVMTTYY